MHRNRGCEDRAQFAARYIQARFPILAHPIGIVLGTGWGDVLKVDDAVGMSYRDIPGFGSLSDLEGHARQLVIGKIQGVPVCCLRGRVHLNEAPADPQLAQMVRLQVEMLLALGVRTLIITSAVGGLSNGKGRPFGVGDVIAVDGFVTLYAPEMPLYAGEFCSPEDTLDPKLLLMAIEEQGKLLVRVGGHVMVRGPFFEGRRYDKRLLAASGADVVGMSMLPEACVAALYEARVLGLGFVTNDDQETHSHETNLVRAKASASELGGFLERIVRRIGSSSGK